MGEMTADVSDAAEFWKRLPPTSASDDEWYSFLQDSSEQFMQIIQKIDQEFEDEPYRRLEEVRRTRREHHLLIVGDRIRRETENGRGLSHKELREAAEKVVDWGARAAATTGDGPAGTTRAGQRMLNSARVHWHKLVHRAGSRSELRGGWGDKDKVRGTKVASAKIRRHYPPVRAQLLREHIRERLEQLVSLSDEISVMPDSRPTREDRLLFRELQLLLQRARRAALQDPAAATTEANRRRRRRRRSLAESRRAGRELIDEPHDSDRLSS